MSKLLGLHPRAARNRNRGALAERDRHGVDPSERDAVLGDVGEQVIGLLELAGQPV